MRPMTKIICTLGPASSGVDVIRGMARAGMDVARLNFSHGNHNEQQSRIKVLRELSRRGKKKISILQDLQGYRIRIGQLKFPRLLERNQVFYLNSMGQENKTHIPFDFQGDLRKIQQGLCVYLDDGKMSLLVVGHSQDALKVKVLSGGLLSSRKGINIPGVKLQSDILIERDKADLEFGVRHQVDYIAQSFVRNKNDITRVIDVVKGRLPKCKFIAKIENEEGLRNLHSIMDACDGIMVARGDLGISLPIHKIAVIQKKIIRRCNERKKFVITATQMLESMTENNRPTRAEVSDVTNAILDGTDFVMLSGETAVGKFPIETVSMMRRIADFTRRKMPSLIDGGSK